MSSIPADVVLHKRAPTEKEVRKILTEAESVWLKTHHHMFMAVDLEFTRNHFALIQICFDTGRGSDRIRTVYLSNTSFPGLIDLLISPHLVKLVHGSESNDVPWLLSQIPDYQQAELFVNFVDTRFIAEYINPDLKPGLYDVLVRFGAITTAQVNELLATEKSLGRIQHVDWRLNKMRDNAIAYAVHDVLHLRTVYTEARRRDTTIPQFRNILRVCFMQRFLDTLNKTEVERVSNYFLERNKLPLMDISTRIIAVINVPDLDFKRIMRIGWMRPPTQLLLRRIIYGLLVRHVHVMSDKTHQFTKVLQPIPDSEMRWSSLDHLIIELRRSVQHALANKKTLEK